MLQTGLKQAKASLLEQYAQFEKQCEDYRQQISVQLIGDKLNGVKAAAESFPELWEAQRTRLKETQSESETLMRQTEIFESAADHLQLQIDGKSSLCNTFVHLTHAH